jgi:hypothetical protein
MPVCDLCGKQVETEGILFWVTIIKFAVVLGLRPPKGMTNIGEAFGVSSSHITERWVQQVMKDTTGWLLCPKCGWRVRLRIWLPLLIVALIVGAVAWYLTAS